MHNHRWVVTQIDLYSSASGQVIKNNGYFQQLINVSSKKFKFGSKKPKLSDNESKPSWLTHKFDKRGMGKNNVPGKKKPPVIKAAQGS